MLSINFTPVSKGSLTGLRSIIEGAFFSILTVTSASILPCPSKASPIGLITLPKTP